MISLLEDRYTFLIVSRWTPLRISKFSDRDVENIKAHVLRLINLSRNCALYVQMMKGHVEPHRPQRALHAG